MLYFLERVWRKVFLVQSSFSLLLIYSPFYPLVPSQGDGVRIPEKLNDAVAHLDCETFLQLYPFFSKDFGVIRNQNMVLPIVAQFLVTYFKNFMLFV